jgi:hypothetical protein
MILKMTAGERVPFFGLALVAALSPRLPAGLTLVLTFGLVLLIVIGGGLTATPFQAMVAKIIPPRRHGAFYGLKTSSANLLLRNIDHSAVDIGCPGIEFRQNRRVSTDLRRVNPTRSPARSGRAPTSLQRQHPNARFRCIHHDQCPF